MCVLADVLWSNLLREQPRATNDQPREVAAVCVCLLISFPKLLLIEAFEALVFG